MQFFKPRKIRKMIENFSVYFSLSIISFVMTFSVYWLIITALTPRENLYVFPPKIFPLNASLKSFSIVFTKYPVIMWLFNSFLVSIATSTIAVIVASFAGYSLSRYKIPGRNVVQILILFTQMVPATLMVIPIYLIFMVLGLLDSRLGLVAAYSTLSLPFCVLMLTAFFESIPQELEEAALIDGCTRIQALFKIVLPLSLPGIVATTFFSFVIGWDQFLLPSVLMSTRSKWPITVGLHAFYGQYDAYYDEIAATGFVSIFPVLVIFLLLQKYLVEGMTAGSIKG